MLDLKFPEKVKHLSAVIYRDETLYQQVIKICGKKFGSPDFESKAIPFVFTDYYQPEMGPELKRRFLSFPHLIRPEQITAIKLFNVKLEKKFACAKKRRINVDPGYMNCAKLVLATTKDYSHRIYLNKGIFAEVTLTYKNNQWQDLPSTFPDYRTDVYKEILSRIREIYCRQIKKC